MKTIDRFARFRWTDIDTTGEVSPMNTPSLARSLAHRCEACVAHSRPWTIALASLATEANEAARGKWTAAVRVDGQRRTINTLLRVDRVSQVRRRQDSLAVYTCSARRRARRERERELTHLSERAIWLPSRQPVVLAASRVLLASCFSPSPSPDKSLLLL